MRTQTLKQLLQLRILRLGLLQDGDVGVGVFPEGEEVLVSRERSDAGGIGVSPSNAGILTPSLKP